LVGKLRNLEAKLAATPRRLIENFKALRDEVSGELCPRVSFIVSSMSRPAENIVAFYNKRVSGEQWINVRKAMHTLSVVIPVYRHR
jgi:hypothetical protein